jgi:hypothetical protein
MMFVIFLSAYKRFQFERRVRRFLKAATLGLIAAETVGAKVAAGTP